MATAIPLCEYLFRRLRQIGIHSLHGVPGDYNLIALDYVESSGLHWVGDANELNAGYAADGYARVKGVGALITTFGVGELSAINAIAGSYAEKVPVVHIVGAPSTLARKDHLLLHHTLGNGDYGIFGEIYAKVTCAQVSLADASMAPVLIDHVLRACVLQSRPVYIEFPTDRFLVKVDSRLLDHPIDLCPPVHGDCDDTVTYMLQQRILEASQPALLIDAGALRFGLSDLVKQFVQISKLPAFTSPMAKGLLDEDLDNFCGIYAGDGSKKDQKEYIEKSDLVVCIGSIKTDFNTTGFTYKLSDLDTVYLHSDHARVGSNYHEIRLTSVLKRLLVTDWSGRLSLSKTFPRPEREMVPDGTEITQKYLWNKLGDWLRPDDIVLVETGTSYMGIWDTILPPRTKILDQTLWGSIGAMLPIAQGAALAARDLQRSGRVILFEGDGSFQLTAQAIGTIIKNKLDLIIVLLNNDGYTIERWVHGMHAKYNDIAAWKYKDIPAAMGGKIGKTARNREELEKLWEAEEMKNPKELEFVEILMPKYDAPESLKLVCAAAAKTNAG